ncbi:hypothetical protein GEV33_008246 [Tenebrio molitor]|uniref:Uncharacterized protein n=1 Tax=Tenebrio molitor TaxID=7067 RepID=A0A8J6HH01_TENMO|nr:hypothetical protein GEV33_008246 [Tenebrio molitor]
MSETSIADRWRYWRKERKHLSEGVSMCKPVWCTPMSHPRQQITRQRHNENIIHIDKHPQLLEKSEQKTDLNEVNTTSYQSEDKPAENINVIVASRRFLCWENGLSLTILIVTYSEALMNTEHQQKPKRRKTACLFARMRDGREQCSVVGRASSCLSTPVVGWVAGGILAYLCTNKLARVEIREGCEQQPLTQLEYLKRWIKEVMELVLGN